MCDFENGFILCTCIEEEVVEEKKVVPVKKMRTKKKKLLNKFESPPQLPIDFKKYVWELRTLRKIEICKGRCSFPSDDIGKGLESDWVELNLNDRNCFDFEFSPNEGDELVFYNEINIYCFLAFIYKNGSWVKGYYNELQELTKLKQKGRVKVSNILKN